eukprot:606752-Hanusia_phi.AAC.1
MRIEHEPLLLEDSHLPAIYQAPLVVHPFHERGDDAGDEEGHDTDAADADEEEEVQPSLQTSTISLARDQLAGAENFHLVATDSRVEKEGSLHGGVWGTAGGDDGEVEEDGEVGSAESELEVGAEGAGKTGLDAREDLHADDGEDSEEDEEEDEAAEADLRMDVIGERAGEEAR